MMKKLIYILLCVISLCSCEKNSNDVNLCFLGDSMISYWDVETSFPNYKTQNMGFPGIHIDNLEKYNVSSEDIAVVEIGTNDWTFVDNEGSLYYDKYERIVSNIAAKKVYLLQILPTSNRTRNSVIEKMNDSIAIRMKKHPRIKIINCYDAFEKDGVLKEDLTRDGLHLNDYGYIKLANIVKKEL